MRHVSTDRTSASHATRSLQHRSPKTATWARKRARHCVTGTLTQQPSPRRAYRSPPVADDSVLSLILLPFVRRGKTCWSCPARAAGFGAVRAAIAVTRNGATARVRLRRTWLSLPDARRLGGTALMPRSSRALTACRPARTDFACMLRAPEHVLMPQLASRRREQRCIMILMPQRRVGAGAATSREHAKARRRSAVLPKAAQRRTRACAGDPPARHLERVREGIIDPERTGITAQRHS